MEYQMIGFRENDLVKLEIKINGEPADALSVITHRDNSYKLGKQLVSKLKELIPRQMFNFCTIELLPSKHLKAEDCCDKETGDDQGAVRGAMGAVRGAKGAVGGMRGAVRGNSRKRTGRCERETGKWSLVPIQACIGVKVIASEQIAPYRKDVTAKCYGGDISRKKKLLSKQVSRAVVGGLVASRHLDAAVSSDGH
eukprot:632684-Pelagomonas_calceolata.AAC.8